MQENIEISKQKNQEILNSLIRIFGKFEKLMHYEGRAETRDPAKRDALMNAQRNLLQKIRDANRANNGLFVKLEDVNSTIRFAEQLADQTHSSSLMSSENTNEE